MSIGTDGYAEGTNVVALGASSRAIGVNGMAYGSDARAEGTNVSAFGTGAWATGVGSTAIGPRAYAFGVQTLSVGAYSSAEVAYASAFGPGATARAFGSTAIGMNAVTTRPFEVSIGSAYSPYSLPGLHPNGFVGDRYQKPGEKRFVTTDQNGTLGTTSYSPDQVVASIGAVGALSAAMGSVPVTTLLPDESVRCGVGTGTYGGQYAGSLGCAAKVANRLFFNGGVAMTATDTVNNGAMGRLGFSIGFGGAPKKAKQAELAAIPTMNMGGNSLFELGNGQGVTAEVADSDVLMAKRSEPDLIPAIQPQNSHDRNERDQSTQHRFEQLESEIARLRKEVEKNSSTQDRDDEYFIALEQLEKLKKEKEQLSKMLGSLRNQLNQQQKTIQLLLEKVELNAQR
ncbi:yadA-like C-terminal region family protein [Synechococcus sp. Minos11]|uniref:YadA-like family protein n=1 Tax=Synechococcus sp. Minos11 TaxID=221341 RepID=UPI001648C216|nr:YadA-like family protein [Synechococcus sp. Minos11]QNJ09288.1 yadA-like C-terminal region family protein [Synechococcus sp. Minos11]